MNLYPWTTHNVPHTVTQEQPPYQIPGTIPIRLQEHLKTEVDLYPWMTHHTVPQEQPPYQSQTSTPPNRFIYVKQNFVAPVPPSAQPKVLINPHFKKKVYVNPQFKPPQPVPAPEAPHSVQKPKIHVNPNVLSRFTTASTTVPVSREIKPEVKTSKPEVKTKTVVSTRNKLVRVPCKEVVDNKSPRKRRRSLHTKYKIVRSTSSSNLSAIGNDSTNKFKLDKRTNRSSISSTSTPAKLNNSTGSRRKYVYINRFLSMSVMAKSVVLKQSPTLRRSGFVKINGMLYKKSPNSLKRQLSTSVKKETSVLKSAHSSKSKYKIVRKQTAKLDDNRKSLIKRHKLIRSRKQHLVKISPSKLRKCNIPCPVYRKFGKCKGKENGTCFKLHNPDQIVLCTRFLQGACLDKDCLLSHKVSLEKMPTCKYYLDGLCSRDDCPYLHVKISPKADICRDFLEGFCKKGAQCDKRHQFLCPEYEKTKSCPKRRCPYPHGDRVRNLRKYRRLSTSLAKKCSSKKEKPKTAEILPVQNRYYDDSKQLAQTDVSGKAECCQKGARPKLGTLPAFIPLFRDT